MELFRWRVRNWLVVVVAVLLIAHGMGKADDQAEGSSGDDGDGGDSSPPVQPAPARARHAHTRLHRRQHQHQRDHEHDRGHEHDHKQAQRAKLASHHHKHQAKHQPDAKEGTEAVPAPLTLPYGHSNEGEPHDLLDCEPQSGDKLLARAVVKAEFRPLGFAQASWFYPQNGSDQRTIHCVRALDQRRDGHGGYPKIQRGGVGHHYVELSFTSDFSRGFHFVVEVYGQ